MLWSWLLLCLFTGISVLGAYFFALSLFFGSSPVFHQPSLLSVCYDGSLFFNFVGQFDFGCYLLAQEMISVIHYLPCFREWLIGGMLLAFLPFQCLFTDSLALRPAPCPSPFLWYTFSIPTPSPVMLDHSLLFVIQVFLGGVSLPRGCVGLSQGWLGEFCEMRGTHLFGLLNVSQVGLEPVAAAAEAVATLMFSQCNMLWGSFP
jgi:hypothetical protein